MNRRIFIPRFVTTIVKAIVRVFSKSKRTSRGQNGIPEAQPKNKKNRELLSLSKSRKQRNRGDLCYYYTDGNSSLFVAEQSRMYDAQRSTYSQMSFSLKFSTSIDWLLCATHRARGNGTDLRTYPNDGDTSYFHHLVVWIYDSSTHTKTLSGRPWICGPSFPSPFGIPYLQNIVA
jgi:hypothetical protein